MADPNSPNAIKGAETWTEEEEASFLGALASTRCVAASCAAIGRGRTSVYQHRKDSPEFAGRWKRVRRHNRTDLRDNVFARATDGWLEPVFYKGEQVATIRKFSDTLSIFCMKLAGYIPRDEAERGGVPSVAEQFRAARERKGKR